jgi:predicted DNA-binding transcriptional regulator AlpA
MRRKKVCRTDVEEQPKQQRHHLYRHFDIDGRLLYVGISLHAIGRLRSHRDKSEWFDKIAEVKIEVFGSRDEALQAERIAVSNEKPAYNRNLRRWMPAKRREQRTPQVSEPKKAPRRMLSFKHVMRSVPVGRHKLMRMIEHGEFPSPHYISPKKPVWFDDEIKRWKGQPSPNCAHIAPSASIPVREARPLELGPTLEPRP